MTESSQNGAVAANRWPQIKTLYYDLVDDWYGDRVPRRARRLADRLSALVERQDPNQEAVLGQECRALAREVCGDLAGAIRHRLKEIRMRKRLLHLMPPRGQRTGVQKDVLKGYDVADLADRYDLLATLYHDAGQLKKAIRALWQSRELCELHGIKFDGKGLLRDYLGDYRTGRPKAPSGR